MRTNDVELSKVAAMGSIAETGPIWIRENSCGFVVLKVSAGLGENFDREWARMRTNDVELSKVAAMGLIAETGPK